MQLLFTTHVPLPKKIATCSSILLSPQLNPAVLSYLWKQSASGEMVIPCDLRKCFFSGIYCCPQQFLTTPFPSSLFSLYRGKCPRAELNVLWLWPERSPPTAGLCYHVRNSSPLPDKVSWPNLSHIPLQSKQSQCLCTEINHNL